MNATEAELPTGIVRKHYRHHSAPEPQIDAPLVDQLDAMLEALREMDRAVWKIVADVRKKRPVEGSSMLTSLVQLQHAMGGAIRTALEAGTDAALDDAVAALPPGTSDEVYHATIALVVTRREACR